MDIHSSSPDRPDISVSDRYTSRCWCTDRSLPHLYIQFPPVCRSHHSQWVYSAVLTAQKGGRYAVPLPLSGTERLKWHCGITICVLWWCHRNVVSASTLCSKMTRSDFVNSISFGRQINPCRLLLGGAPEPTQMLSLPNHLRPEVVKSSQPASVTAAVWTHMAVSHNDFVAHETGPKLVRLISVWAIVCG